MGNNFDTFAPMGPCIVTADEIPDPSMLRLRLLLNGQVMQDGTNEDWLFPLPRLLAWLSSAMTLEPGDVVTTGTPAGVGFFRHPQVFLKPGERRVRPRSACWRSSGSAGSRTLWRPSARAPAPMASASSV